MPRLLVTALLAAVLSAACGGGGSDGGGGTANAYHIGGTITGLSSATGLVLANGIDTLTVPAGATSFSMPTAVANGAAYDVTVRIHPTALNCTVISGAGTVTGADVASISVHCGPGTESVLYSFKGAPADGAYPNSLIQASDGDLYGVAGGDTSNLSVIPGVVFKISSTGTESVLYAFKGGTTDGADPISLIQASDGNFYGMTDQGGTNGFGTVFKVTPGGSETVLYSFADLPFFSLIQASDGNFYGVTAQGGMNGLGTVFKVTPDGSESLVYSFSGGADGASPAGGLIEAGDGNLYGVTRHGGAYGLGTVFKVTPGGTETVLYSFGGMNDGFNPVGALIQASDGNFYGTTSYGGPNGIGTVFRVTPGGAETVLYSFRAMNDGAQPVGGLIQASDGDLYGVAGGGGAYTASVLFRITLAGEESVLYSFPSLPYPGGLNPGLIQARDGNLYGTSHVGGTRAFPAADLGIVFEFN